jgi:dienelactone hydrolase
MEAFNRRALVLRKPYSDSPQFSPDGQWVAYIDGVAPQSIMAFRLMSEDDRTILSLRDQVRILAFRWMPNSRDLICCFRYISSEACGVAWLSLDGAITQLSSPGFLSLMPIAQVQNDPHTVFVMGQKRGRSFWDLFSLNTHSENLIDVEKNDGHVARWHMGNTGEVLARSTRVLSSEDLCLEIRVGKKSDWRPLCRWECDDVWASVVGFSHDDSCVWTLCRTESNTTALVEIDVENGSSRVLAHHAKYDLRECLLRPEAKGIDGVGYVASRRHWIPLNELIRSDFAFLSETLPGDFIVRHRNMDDSLWLVEHITDTAPIEHLIVNRSSHQIRPLVRNDPSPEVPAIRTLGTSFITQSGTELQLYLTQSTTHVSRSCVVLLHGGPWSRETWGYSQEAHWLARAGLVVLQLNYRGSWGFGKEFQRAGYGRWDTEVVNDICEAKKWAAEECGCSGPAAVAGYSFGGYLAVKTLEKGLFSCAISINGPVTRNSLLNTGAKSWRARPRLLNLAFNETESVSSQIDCVSHGHPPKPLLLIMSTSDFRTDVNEGLAIAECRRKAGGIAETLLIKDEGHIIEGNQNRVDVFDAISDFLKRHCLTESEVSRCSNWNPFENSKNV